MGLPARVDNPVKLTVNIAAELHRKLKVKAAERGVPMGVLVEELIRNLTK